AELIVCTYTKYIIHCPLAIHLCLLDPWWIEIIVSTEDVGSRKGYSTCRIGCLHGPFISYTMTYGTNAKCKIIRFQSIGTTQCTTFSLVRSVSHVQLCLCRCDAKKNTSSKVSRKMNAIGLRLTVVFYH
ncbi:hypothetical protein Tcan_00788, partial [Toxocara canis]